MANKKDLNKGAAAATAKLFSNTGKPQSAQPQSSVKNSKKEKRVFSFRGEEGNIKAWRLYATVTGTKVDDLGSLALQEYIENHPLKGAEKALFDEKMKK